MANRIESHTTHQYFLHIHSLIGDYQRMCKFSLMNSVDCSEMSTRTVADRKTTRTNNCTVYLQYSVLEDSSDQ